MENQNDVWITGATIYEQRKSKSHELKASAVFWLQFLSVILIFNFPPLSSTLIHAAFLTFTWNPNVLPPLLPHFSPLFLDRFAPTPTPHPPPCSGWVLFGWVFYTTLQNAAEQVATGQHYSPACYSCVGRDRGACGAAAAPFSEKRKDKNYYYHHHLWFCLHHLILTVTTVPILTTITTTNTPRLLVILSQQL